MQRIAVEGELQGGHGCMPWRERVAQFRKHPDNTGRAPLPPTCHLLQLFFDAIQPLENLF
jgi:hypothetical protein